MRLDQPGASRQQRFVDANDFTRRLANPSCEVENPYAVCFAQALELTAACEVLWCKIGSSVSAENTVAYTCAVPPSTNCSIPVTKLESSDARKSAAAAISCG